MLAKSCLHNSETLMVWYSLNPYFLAHPLTLSGIVKHVESRKCDFEEFVLTYNSFSFSMSVGPH